jgi:site-specific recombinase XerD
MPLTSNSRYRTASTFAGRQVSAAQVSACVSNSRERYVVPQGHFTHHRAVSPRTVAAFGDTFRLLLQFAERHTGKLPTDLKLVNLNSKLVLDFLDHLERDRKNGARSRNARLAALRSFLKCAAHHHLSAIGVIEQALAVPMKRFDRPMLGFLTRQEMQALIDAPKRFSQFEAQRFPWRKRFVVWRLLAGRPFIRFLHLTRHV